MAYCRYSDKGRGNKYSDVHVFLDYRACYTLIVRLFKVEERNGFERTYEVEFNRRHKSEIIQLLESLERKGYTVPKIVYKRLATEPEDAHEASDFTKKEKRSKPPKDSIKNWSWGDLPKVLGKG